MLKHAAMRSRAISTCYRFNRCRLMHPLLSTILRYIKLIPLLAIRERGHGNHCTLFTPARIIPLMKESLHTCARPSIPMLVPSNNISNETRHPLADRSSVLVKFIQSIPRGGDSATVRTNVSKLLSYRR